MHTHTGKYFFSSAFCLIHLTVRSSGQRSFWHTISTKHRPQLGFLLLLQSRLSIIHGDGWAHTHTHSLSWHRTAFPLSLAAGHYLQLHSSSVPPPPVSSRSTMFLCCQSTYSLPKCECYCPNFTNLMLYEQRPSSQFKGVLSSQVSWL